MDAIVSLAIAILVGVAAWTLLGSATPDEARLEVRARAVAHVARRGLAIMSSSQACAALLRKDSFRLAVQELAGPLGRVGIELDEGERATLLALGSFVSCVLVGVFAQSLFVAIAAAPLVVVAYPLRAAQRERAERRELAEQMPGVLRTLATAMGSGQTLMQAIDYVGLHEEGCASQAFVRASLRLRCGMSAEEALGRLSDELDAPGAQLMATALAISQRTGSPLRELFQRSALLVEQQGEFQRMLSVKTAQVRLSVRIVCVLPVALVVLLSLISPDFRQGLHSVPGIVCLLVGAVMDGCALMLIRTILKGVM